MKQFIFLTVLLVSSHAIALGPLPNGRYIGDGGCRSQSGESFRYRVELDVSDKRLTAKYMSDQGDVSDEKDFVFLPQNFFTFVSKEGKGEGYCRASSCHYEATIGGKVGEDTLSLSGRDLRLIGSVQIQGMKFACDDYYKLSSK